MPSRNYPKNYPSIKKCTTIKLLNARRGCSSSFGDKGASEPTQAGCSVSKTATLEKSMKKSSLPCAAMLATTGAFAQSSVTVSGVVDTSIGSFSTGVASTVKMVQGGLIPSQLGFRGTGDLGGGLSAKFILETGINTDSGLGIASNSNNQSTGASTSDAMTFNRRAVVSLLGSWGEVRLGRDYTPANYGLVKFDPFFANGVAQSSNLNLQGAGFTGVRASNSIAYLYNDDGFSQYNDGLYGKVMAWVGENSSTAANRDDGSGFGFRVGYRQGPLNVSFATQKSKVLAFGDMRMTNIGASYDIGFAELVAQYDVANSGLPGTRHGNLLVGAKIKAGNGYIPVSMNSLRVNDAAGRKAIMLGIGYVYTLSKRTSLYTSFAYLDNRNAASAFGINPGGLGGVAGRDGRAVELGVKHSF